MIQQKVKLTKLKTDDGRWNYEDSKVPVGLEFWINCNTFSVRQGKVRGGGGDFQTLMVQTESENWIPVEILEYTSDFRITS